MAKSDGARQTHRRRRIRFPIWAKISTSCLVLSELVVLVMYLQAKHAAAKKDDRGNFLEPHFKHYQDYANGQGRALASVASIIAADDDVEAELSLGLGEPTTPRAGDQPVPNHVGLARLDSVLN